MPFSNQVAARQQPPGRYKKFRRENGKFGDGIDVIWGVTPNGKTEVQSIRFDASKFSTEEARSWLKEHKYKTGVTPATGEPKNHDDGGTAAPVSTASPANSASAITVQTALRPMTVQYNEGVDDETHEIDVDESGMLDTLIDHDIDMDELKMGSEHELEHTDDKKIALKIALDHLIEIPDYYSRLKAAFPEEASEFAAAKGKKEFKLDGDGLLDDENDDEDYCLGFDESGKNLYVEAFEAGTHVDASGTEATWTEKDLDDIAAKANSQLATKPIPVCIGHPSDSSPAYGWVQGVKRFGEKLRVKLSELNPAFAAALKEGAYKTRSISLYDDNRMRHLGFLGGSQPAIEGLQPMSFNEQDHYRIYTFSEDIEMDKMKEQELTFLQNLLKKFGFDVEKAKKEFSEKDFHEAQTVVALETGTPAKVNTTGESINADIKEKETKDPGEQSTAKAENAEIKDAANEEETENAKLKAELEATKAKLAMAEAALAKSKITNADFCESLIKDGVLKPADREITLMGLDAQAQIDQARAVEAKVLGKSFNEAAESGLEKMKALLKAQPKVVQFGEFPVVPAMEAVTEFPKTSLEMQSYIDKRMNDCMTEQDKIGLTPKISYGDMLKKVHREVMDKDPEGFRAYFSEKYLPKMNG